jgi:Arc/MetJ-type ribon-helix-helix transcriptional regulator
MSFHNEEGMGRPPLGMKPTTVRLSVDTINRIKALVGNRRVAVFIREAVEKDLQRHEAPPPTQE